MSTLRQLLAAVGEPLVTVVAAPAGLDVPISGLAIVDPDDEPDDHRGGLVLVVGARGRDAVPLVRAAGAAGASAVAVQGHADGLPSRGDRGGRRAARRTCGRALGAPRVARRKRARRGRERGARRPVRARPDRRPAHPRHRLHRGHGQPGARLLPLRRRRRPDRRAAQAVHPRLAGAHGLPAPPAGMGRVRPAAHGRGSRARRRARRARRAAQARDRHPRGSARAGHDLGAGGRAAVLAARGRRARRRGPRRGRAPRPPPSHGSHLAPRPGGGPARRPGEPRSRRPNVRARRARARRRRGVRGAGG